MFIGQVQTTKEVQLAMKVTMPVHLIPAVYGKPLLTGTMMFMTDNCPSFTCPIRTSHAPRIRTLDGAVNLIFMDDK